MLSRSSRLLMIAVAFLALAAATAIDAPRALAQCCGIGIGNSSPCAFRVTIVLPSGERVVSVPPGGDSWTIPNCDPFRLKVTDVCGVEHYLPTVIGECITVSFGPYCCITICKVTDCRWEAHQTHCLPPCP